MKGQQTVSNENNTHAFVSPATFVIDGRAHPGVITAALWKDDQLEITLQPLCQLPAGITDFKVVIDDEDLRSVNALLRVQAEAEALDELLETTHVTHSAL